MGNLFNEDSTLTLKDNKLLYWGQTNQLKNVSKTIPVKYNDKTRYFEFPVFPAIVNHLEQVVPRLKIAPDLRENLKEREDNVKQFWPLKSKKALYRPLLDVGLHDITLYPHQKVSSKMNELMPRVLCADEMGLGKTIVAIRTALYRKLVNDNKRCLVICPNSIRETVWAKEVAKYTGLGICIPDGPKSKRDKTIKKFMQLNDKDNDYYFMVINYEMTYRYQELLEPFVKDQMLIIDECHYMKNRISKRTKAIYKLKPKYLISMTGTPFDNIIEDIFSLAEYVCPLIFSGSYTKFKDRYCIEKAIHLHSRGRLVTRNVIAGYKNLDELRTILGLISYRRTKKEVLDLPAKTYEKRMIKMTADQWKYYEKMRQECYVLVAGLNEADIESTANGILAKMLRLSQITGGYLTDFADKSKSHWIKNSGKIAELDDIVEQIILSNNKVVIWSRFVDIVHKLTERYKKYGAVFINGRVPVSKRAKIVERFQKDPETKVFVGQIQSCGVGMTLHAACYEVFYDKCFIPSSAIIQAEDRCHRIGMGDRCTIISLVAKGTMDEHWEKIFKDKLSAVNEVLQEESGDQEYKVVPGKVTKNDLLDLLKINK